MVSSSILPPYTQEEKKVLQIAALSTTLWPFVIVSLLYVKSSWLRILLFCLRSARIEKTNFLIEK